MADAPWTEEPDGADLLQTAREVLVADVLPHLAAEQRYPALMVANAMAIAGRAALAPPASDLAASLQALADGTDHAALSRLAAGIRAGDFDPGTSRHAEAADFLLRLTRYRIGVSNPKALA